MARPINRRTRGLIAAAVVIAAAGLLWLADNVTFPSGRLASEEQDVRELKIKSGNLSVDYTLEQALADVERLGLNAVNVPVMVEVDTLTSSRVRVNGESLMKAQSVIHELNKRNVRVLLEPYPWIGKGVYYETDWKPDDVELFFSEWGRAVDEIVDRIAVPESIYALYVASNLVYLETYEKQWADLIDRVKSRYDGLVTYRTNWWYTADWDAASLEAYERKIDNNIFGKVDFVSIAAYFELSDRPVNTVSQLVDALHSTTVYGRKQDVVDEIERLQERWKKPVFFGELGFPKREYAAKHPWNPSPSDNYSADEQARVFEAYRLTFTQNWFMGFSVFAIGEAGEDKHYYPSKQSVEVIRNWYS